MTIDAVSVHPAWVTYMPRRGRKVRTTLARMRTPVLLPEADPDAFERPGAVPPGPGVPIPFAPWIRDGLAWQVLPCIPAAPGEAWRDVTVEEFRTWLAGDLPPRSAVSGSLDRILGGTPLSRRVEHLPAVALDIQERRGWQVFDETAASRLVEDDRSAAAGAVAAFVAREIAVAGDRVLCRVRPGFRLPVRLGGEQELDLGRGDRRRPSFRLDRRGDAEAFSGRSCPEPRALAQARELLAGTLPDDDDLLLACNALPASFLDAVYPFAGGHRSVPDERRATYRDQAAALTRLVRLGERGMIGPEAVGDAFRLMHAVGAFLHAEGRNALGSPARERFAESLAYVERVARPRLAVADLGADADDLAALAP